MIECDTAVSVVPCTILLCGRGRRNVFHTLVARQETPSAFPPNHHTRRQRQRQGQVTIIQRLPSMIFVTAYYTWYITRRHPIPHCWHKTLQVQFHDARSMLIQWIFARGLSLSHSIFRRSSTPFENIVMRERNVCSGSLLYRQLARDTPGIPFSVQWYIGR